MSSLNILDRSLLSDMYFANLFYPVKKQFLCRKYLHSGEIRGPKSRQLSDLGQHVSNENAELGTSFRDRSSGPTMVLLYTSG